MFIIGFLLFLLSSYGDTFSLYTQIEICTVFTTQKESSKTDQKCPQKLKQTTKKQSIDQHKEKKSATANTATKTAKAQSAIGLHQPEHHTIKIDRSSPYSVSLGGGDVVELFVMGFRMRVCVVLA